MTPAQHTAPEAMAPCSTCGAKAEMLFHGNCRSCIEDSIDEPEWDEDEAFLSFTCGYVPGHGCSMAGTEDCDWECPRNAR